MSTLHNFITVNSHHIHFGQILYFLKIKLNLKKNLQFDKTKTCQN